VFVGKVVEIRRPEFALGSASESRFIFEVDAVYKGERVHARQSIVTKTYGASCGLELPVGTSALVFARKDDFDVTPDDGEFASSLCEVISRPAAAVVESLGASKPPNPGSSPVGADDGLPSTIVRNWYWVLAAASAIGLLILWTRRRLHSVRPSPTD
jgi:hypothetical protein